LVKLRFSLAGAQHTITFWDSRADLKRYNPHPAIIKIPGVLDMPEGENE